ncbi:MAG: xanthine phosphoribosyltransferase [Alphaproteobacteria bacterium]|nr:xanthine phosphoribosyltransferase [Alphaproteobacteria bacterium]
MTDKIYIKWAEFHQDVKDLCAKIKLDGKFNKIVAVSRGGLLPSGIIAYELDIRDVSVINVSTYVGDEHLTIEKIENVESVGRVDEKTLIIDDLSDTGQTIHVLKKYFPKAKYITVYAKETGKAEVDLYAREVPNQWLVFPWDI